MWVMRSTTRPGTRGRPQRDSGQDGAFGQQRALTIDVSRDAAGTFEPRM
jgi:hypothetical protein